MRIKMKSRTDTDGGLSTSLCGFCASGPAPAPPPEHLKQRTPPTAQLYLTLKLCFSCGAVVFFKCTKSNASTKTICTLPTVAVIVVMHARHFWRLRCLRDYMNDTKLCAALFRSTRCHRIVVHAMYDDLPAAALLLLLLLLTMTTGSILSSHCKVCHAVPEQ